MKNILSMKYIVPAILVSFVMMSCGQENTPSTQMDKTPPVPVEVKTTTQESQSSFLVASGKIEATDKSRITTRMMGYIENIYVKVGSKVKKGQLLVKINNIDLDAQMAQVNAGIAEAKIAVSNAEKDFNRYTILFKENSATQKELDDITTQFRMAQSRLEAVEQKKNEINAQYAYTSLKSPLSGVVTQKMASQGDMASPGVPILEIESQTGLQVAAMVSESEIAGVQLNDEVEITLKSLDNKTKGSVIEISPSAAHTGGQYLVKIKLNTPSSEIRPGMYATVQFPVEATTASTKIMIPISSIVRQGELTGIYTVSQSNKALLRWLRLGRTYGDQVEVLSGLISDEKYIVSAQGKLYNGANITIQ
jgi:RND family efflux transporter MFP subunit